MSNPLELLPRSVSGDLLTIGPLVSMDWNYSWIVVVLLKEPFVCSIISVSFRFPIVGIRCTFFPLVCFIRTYWWNRSVIGVNFFVLWSHFNQYWCLYFLDLKYNYHCLKKKYVAGFQLSSTAIRESPFDQQNSTYLTTWHSPTAIGASDMVWVLITSIPEIEDTCRISYNV